MQPGVDDFHSRIAQRRGDDLGAAIVAVEAGLARPRTLLVSYRTQISRDVKRERRSPFSRRAAFPLRARVSGRAVNAVIRRFYDQAVSREELGKVSSGSKAECDVHVRPTTRRPRHVDSTVSTPESGSNDRSCPIIVSPSVEPPVTREKPSHNAIAVAAVPDQRAAGLEDASPLGDHARIVSRMGKEPERREEIEDSVEATGPASRKPSHVSVRVAKRGPVPRAFASARRSFDRSSPSTSNPASANRWACLPCPHGTSRRRAPTGSPSTSISRATSRRSLREAEDRLVLEKILGVEVGRPPAGNREWGIGNRVRR